MIDLSNLDALKILRSLPDANDWVSPEAMIAAAAHVDREYGYGYRIGIVTSNYTGGGLFCVRASDGSRFRVFADRYGNVERIPDASDGQA